MSFDPLLITKFIAAWILPPGGIVLLLLIALLIRRRWARSSTILAISAMLGFCLLSLPIVSGTLMAGLEDVPVLNTSDPRLKQAQAIVVLGGGRRSYAPEYNGETVSSATLERVRYGARLHRITKLPIVVTGGTVFSPGEAESVLMARALKEDFNVPVRWVESQSRNTVGNGRYTWTLLQAENIDRIVLVSHVGHMHRSIDIFEGEGFTVLPAPTAYRVTPDDVIVISDFIPSAGAFSSSAYALHEYLGRLWLWITRWF